MKCPFRSKKVIEYTYSTNSYSYNCGKIIRTSVNTDFEECYGDVCPYYDEDYNIPCKKALEDRA